MDTGNASLQRLCCASGCNRSASTIYGRYCHSHVAQVRRHGAIGQCAINKSELAPYLHLIRQRLERNKDGPIRAQLELRWKALKAIAEAVMTDSRTGKPMERHRREAAEEVLRLHGSVTPRDAIEAVLAMYLMLDQEPRKFVDDKAFRAQLVRRVRGLTAANADTWPDKRTGKRKTVYRDVSQRTVQHLAAWLAEALGPAGVWFARLERQDHERRQAELLGFNDALKGLL